MMSGHPQLDIFLATFSIVFVAELGDKTQLAVVAQTLKYKQTWPVFLGGSLALMTVTAIGVIAGRTLDLLVPAKILHFTAAAGFVFMGFWVWRESGRLSKKSREDNDNGEYAPLFRRISPRKSPFITTFTLLFVAEVGDKTQLAVVGLSCKHTMPWLIFAGAATALTVVTAMGAWGGRKLCHLFPERKLLLISGLLFILAGVWMGYHAWHS